MFTMLRQSSSALDSQTQTARVKQAKTEQEAINGQSDIDDAQVDVDVSSVITQVNSISAVQPEKSWQLQQQQQMQPQGRLSWKHRVKNLLCCLSPPSPAVHSNQDVQLINSIYHPVPPQPPRLYREAVIGAKSPEDVHKKTLVLDLDETLVHSSFKPIPNPDYIIPVEIDGRLVDVYVLKRPWLDHFMNTVRAQQAHC